MQYAPKISSGSKLCACDKLQFVVQMNEELGMMH